MNNSTAMIRGDQDDAVPHSAVGCDTFNYWSFQSESNGSTRRVINVIIQTGKC